MEKSNKLTEELNKILFLSGLKNKLFEYIETDDLESDNETRAEDNAETNIISKKIFGDYLNTKEDDVLNFPMKYAMVSTNANTYLKDMEYLYLKLKQKNLSIKQIVQLICPEKEFALSKDDYKKLNNSTRDFLFELESNIKRGNSGNVDKILKVNAGEELSQYKDITQGDNSLNLKKEDLKRDFQAASGDEKAIISYKFNSKDNDLKLTPLGFWQIQFLSRIFKGTPKKNDILEEVLFHSKAFGAYYNKAERTLSDFYKHAIFPMTAILTGRSYKINPNDHEFEIILQKSWDKIKDQISKYDASKNNFGAWAFTVARNETIDQIKKIANYKFRDSIEAKEAVVNQNLVYLHFAKDVNKRIPQEYLVRLNPNDKEDAYEIKKRDINSTFLYKFKSPDDLFEFLRMYKDNQSVLKSLSRISKTVLNGLKVLHSIKKNADIWQDNNEDDFFDAYGKKAEGDEKGVLLKKLFTLYNNSAEKYHANSKNYIETEQFKSMTNENRQRLYSDGEIEESFKQDVGMAFFFYQTEYVKDLPVIESKIPEEVINSILKKYIYVLPEKTNIEIVFKKESFKYIDKTLRNSSKGDIISNPVIFNNRNLNNGIIDELAPYIRHNYKVARTQKTSKEITDSLKQEFVQQQELKKSEEIESAKSENRKPRPVYTFENDVDKLFSGPIADGLNGVLGLKRQKNSPNFIKNLETIKKISYTLSNLTGFNIQLEENNSINGIKNYLLEIKQNFIKKTLL